MYFARLERGIQKKREEKSWKRKNYSGIQRSARLWRWNWRTWGGIRFHREYNLSKKPLQVDVVIVDEEEGKREEFLGSVPSSWREPRGGAWRIDGEGEEKKKQRQGLAGILRRYNRKCADAHAGQHPDGW